MVWGTFNGVSKTIEYPSLDANQEASIASSWQGYDQGLANNCKPWNHNRFRRSGPALSRPSSQNA